MRVFYSVQATALYRTNAYHDALAGESPILMTGLSIVSQSKCLREKSPGKKPVYLNRLSAYTEMSKINQVYATYINVNVSISNRGYHFEFTNAIVVCFIQVPVGF